MSPTIISSGRSTDALSTFKRQVTESPSDIEEISFLDGKDDEKNGHILTVVSNEFEQSMSYSKANKKRLSSTKTPRSSSSSLSSWLHHHHHHYHHHRHHNKKNEVDPFNLGFPGYLTTVEHASLVQFHHYVSKQSNEFQDAVFCYGYNEPEEYALCRWLRARKFQVAETIKLVEEAMVLRNDASKFNFFPDANEALGVSYSIYKSQYPHILFGYSKDKCPILYSKAGSVNPTALECVTTFDNMNNLQWHVVVHSFADMFRHQQSVDCTYKRFQSMIVMDLENLSRAFVSKRYLDLLSHQAKVDATCFPETMHRCIVINAPAFFAAVWAIIKLFLEPQVAARVEIYSSKSKGERRLEELIDLDQLPMEYGGLAPSIADMILHEEKISEGGHISRRVTELMNLRAHASTCIELVHGESMDVVIYTRSTMGAVFSVTRVDDPMSKCCSDVLVKSTGKGENHVIESKTIVTDLQGPGRFKVHGEAVKSHFLASEHYLIVGNITKCEVPVKRHRDVSVQDSPSAQRSKRSVQGDCMPPVQDRKSPALSAVSIASGFF